MKRIDVSKIFFYAISITGLLSLSFAFGLYSAARKTVVYETVRTLKNTVEESLNLVSEEATTLTKTRPEHFLQPARYDGAGVTVNDFADSDEEFVLLSGFFNGGNELRLIRRNGIVIARWPVRFSEIFPDASHMIAPPATDWNIDIHGVLALPDGSVVFNFEYGGMVKLNHCGNIVWKLTRASHHSVELGEDGSFWVPGSQVFREDNESPFRQFQSPFNANTIMKVSKDGKVLNEISVPKLFYDNGLEALLTSNRDGKNFVRYKSFGGEIVHLNKIAELPSAIAEDFQMFEAGDLLLSLCYLHMVLVVNPNTGEIRWWQMGPWLRQHDPEFKPGGTILVFNNNMYMYDRPPEDYRIQSGPYGSNIMEVNPVSNEIRIIFGDKKGQEMLTDSRGKHELTRNGGLLVTEFAGGRVFETDATGRIIWEYINRFDSDFVAEVTEARIYPADYFSISDWSCE